MNGYWHRVGDTVKSKAVGEIPAFEGRVVARFMNDQPAPKPFYHVEGLGATWHRDESDLTKVT